MKKRFIQFFALTLVFNFAMSIFIPATALARPRHHRHHGWHWYPPIITGHIINRPIVHPYPVIYNYSVYKQKFLNSLDDEESALYIWLETLPEGKHAKPYGKDVTKRRLKKIMNALYQEYKYQGVQNGYIYFEKL